MRDLAMGELLVVRLDLLQVVEVVDHHAERLPGALGRQVGERVQPFQPRAVVEMEAGHRIAALRGRPQRKVEGGEALQRLERLNPLADLSAKGVKQSFGMMVNYLYDLQKVEVHHEKFLRAEVAHSRAIGALL